MAPAGGEGGTMAAVRAVTFATAGHIDHGKTALVASLTGVDCDRLAEEKRRGITIVLGFAPLADPRGDLEISFVDVPGHERLVHTMIAGAGAVDRALLVIAADEGIMPQTREHLEVLELLGVRGGVVALNKCDLVEPAALAGRVEEVRRELAGGPLGGAPVLPCSATRGDGVAGLRDALLACARGVERREERHRPFRMGFDRVFTLPGAGTVVTGTVRWGRVRVGDELTALPSGLPVRVRGVQVHGHDRAEASVGERAALRCAGATVTDLPRGEQLVSAGPWTATSRLALDLRLVAGAPEVEEGDTLWLHLLAARRVARVERLLPSPLPPGGAGRAVVRLAVPVFAAPGDRVVLRRISPVRTVGGGEVLDSQPPPLRRRDAGRLAGLRRPLEAPDGALALWVEQAGTAGVEVPRLAGRLGVLPEGVEEPLGRLLSAGKVAVVRGNPPVVVAVAAVDALRKEAAAVLEQAGTVGLPAAELLSRLLPAGSQRMREFALDSLRRAGVVREEAGRVVAAGLAPVEDPLAAKVEAAYREAGFDAPSPEEVGRRLGANPRVVLGLVRYLIDRQRLVRIGGKWVLHRQVVDEVVRSLRSWGVDAFDVGQFKERFSLTRKLAIPLLEWLDSARVTRREGERRRLLAPRGDTRSSG